MVVLRGRIREGLGRIVKERRPSGGTSVGNETSPSSLVSPNRTLATHNSPQALPSQPYIHTLCVQRSERSVCDCTLACYMSRTSSGSISCDLRCTGQHNSENVDLGLQ